MKTGVDSGPDCFGIFDFRTSPTASRVNFGSGERWNDDGGLGLKTLSPFDKLRTMP